MAELDRAAISARIKKARLEAGLTQREFGDVLEPPVHYRTIQDWESPKKKVVPFDYLEQIARVTRQTRDWLLHGREAKVTDDREILDELAALRALLEEIRELL